MAKAKTSFPNGKKKGDIKKTKKEVMRAGFKDPRNRNLGKKGGMFPTKPDVRPAAKPAKKMSTTAPKKPPKSKYTAK